jgi:hypothetical protein
LKMDKSYGVFLLWNINDNKNKWVLHRRKWEIDIHGVIKEVEEK